MDLKAFYERMVSEQGFLELSLADDTITENFYPGLTAVATEQCLPYVNMLMNNMGEMVLVQVKNSGDVATVKSILQARVDYMAGDGETPGGAWYPEATRIWSECSRIVSHGNYVMLVVGENSDTIVSQFNSLF